MFFLKNMFRTRTIFIMSKTILISCEVFYICLSRVGANVKLIEKKICIKKKSKEKQKENDGTRQRPLACTRAHGRIGLAAASQLRFSSLFVFFSHADSRAHVDSYRLQPPDRVPHEHAVSEPTQILRNSQLIRSNP
jgi:hypothetical protein